MFHYYFHLFIYSFELALLVKTLTNFNIIYPKKLQDVETDYLLDISLKP